MWILSIDLETTGLNPATCQILEIGAVLDNTDWWRNPDFRVVNELPKFRAVIERDLYTGEAIALAMNHKLIRSLGMGEKLVDTIYTNEEDVCGFLGAWLNIHAGVKVTPTGKNFGTFDLQFLNRLPHFAEYVGSRLHHRILDVGSLYFDPDKDKDSIPNLATCLERAGIIGEVKHEAVEDAKQCIQLIRADGRR